MHHPEAVMKLAVITGLCLSLGYMALPAQTADDFGGALSVTNIQGDEPSPPAPLRPDPFREFHRAFITVAASPSQDGLRSLYSRESDDMSIAADAERMNGLFGDGAKGALSFVFKDLDRLAGRAHMAWSQMIGRLTSQKASVLCLVRTEHGVQVMLPLQLTQDGLRIVPADKLLGNE
jgi:hypothetical protein